MAPRNVVEEPVPAQGSVDQEVEEDSEPEFKRPPRRIVWRNVVLMSSLHLASLYALTLIPRSHPLTWLWSKPQVNDVILARKLLFLNLYRLARKVHFPTNVLTYIKKVLVIFFIILQPYFTTYFLPWGSPPGHIGCGPTSHTRPGPHYVVCWRS